MSRRPPLIAPGSDRANAMQRNATIELGRSAAYSRLPGYFAARLTRAYEPDEHAAGAGMTEEQLQEAEEQSEAPVFIQHTYDGMVGGKRRKLTAGRVFASRYGRDDNFLYVRGLINVGDRGPGDFLYNERKKGNFGYVSAGFTVPTADDPNPRAFASRLLEVSFVNEPHEPYAQVLACHSSSDTGNPVFTRILTICSPMSSTPATPAATPATPAASDPAPAATPKSALPSADQIKAIVAESQRLAQQNAEFQAQLNFYEQQHAAKMTPVVKALTDHYAGDPDLNDDERAHLTAYAAELASKPSTAGIVAYNHRMIEKLSAAQAQLAEHAKAREASNAATSEWSTVLQEALSGAQANAAPLPFSSGQPPMIRQHAAGARMAPVPATFPPVDRDLAKKLEERIKARMYEYEGRKQPDAKRVPPSQ